MRNSRHEKSRRLFQICGGTYEVRHRISTMPLLIQYSVSCVPTPQVNSYTNGDVLFDLLISELITLGVENDMRRKVPKSKDFYKVSLCSNTIVSTCLVCGNMSKGFAWTSS